VLCAAPIIGDDPFAVLLADDFLGTEGQDFLGSMVQSHAADRP